MRVPLEWLADYVDIEIPVDQLAEKLTMFGLKIEAVERAESGWKDIYIAQVVEIEPHPSSRKPLWIARVDDGSGDPVRVVTGAQNVKLHDKVPFVKIGGVLPHGPDGNPLRIQEREMAGIASQGMLASQFELGLSDEHSGIFILPADAPLGAPLATVLGGDVLVIETHPNRPDTLSIIGVAREAAAALQQQLTLPDLEDLQSAVEWIDAESIPVQVQAPELCPRYTALRIAGVGNAPSPWRIASRIEAAGMRSINLLVDLTHYVMLEYGQPVHAFDADLAGDEIVIRRARAEETLTTLDGITR
ncbi:MAG: phenylalanine--tRNA ligase beta subunit-related protein, partial [Chloroflexota bacterium]